MMYLSKESYERAKGWIESNARPLEKARMHYYFDGGSESEILKELLKFQNTDGGFGHALEPDLRTPDSSILATSLAFQIQNVASANKYLLNNYDKKNKTWRIIPLSAEDSPHAPWWDQADQKEKFLGFHLNPTAEILGYLPEFNSNLGEKILGVLKKLNEIEMHDFLCSKRLVESKNIPEEFRQNLIIELGRLLDTCLVTDPSKWNGYGLRPLQIVDSPNSFYYKRLQNLVEVNLDYEIDAQDRSGAWLPTWSWQGKFPEEWEKAKTEWSGILTLEKLSTFKRFDRIK